MEETPRRIQERMKKCKEKYFTNMVQDLKSSDPRKWYSKIKRMGGLSELRDSNADIDEFEGMNSLEQANQLADFFSETRNSFQPIDPQDF